MCLRIGPCVKEHYFHSIFCTQPPVRKYLSKKALARNSGNQITPPARVGARVIGVLAVDFVPKSLKCLIISSV